MSIELFLGLDLAWQDSRPGLRANETGIAVLDADGQVVDAGWTRGLDETAERIAAAGDLPALLFIDAPLAVDNPTGQRACETQVGQRYGRWKVSANTTNLRSPRQAGVSLLRRLRERGWSYSDGHDGPPRDGRWCCECYPYTTLVGAPELGYDTERPRYKRSPRRMPVATWRPIRQAACDDLIRRMTRLAHTDPPLRLDSHPITRQLVAEPSPLQRHRLQTPRRPHRRPALRLDRRPLVPPRHRPLPSPRTERLRHRRIRTHHHRPRQTRTTPVAGHIKHAVA